MGNYELDRFIEKYLPKDTQPLSRDAVIILLKLVWDKAKEETRKRVKEDEREEKYGPYDI